MGVYLWILELSFKSRRVMSRFDNLFAILLGGDAECVFEKPMKKVDIVVTATNGDFGTSQGRSSQQVAGCFEAKLLLVFQRGNPEGFSKGSKQVSFGKTGQLC